MNCELGVRGRCGRTQLEILAASAALLIIAAVVAIALSRREEPFKTSGSNVDIQLVAVRADARSQLYSPTGIPNGTSSYSGSNFVVSSNSQLRRDFLFKMPLEIVPASYTVQSKHQWLTSQNQVPDNSAEVNGERHYTVETLLSEYYWRNTPFISSQRRLRTVDFLLQFYPPDYRYAPYVQLPGPFNIGVTNAIGANKLWVSAVTETNGETRTHVDVITSIASGRGHALSFVTINDTRLRFVLVSSTNSGNFDHLRGYVEKVAPGQLKSAQFHGPQQKVFHNVRVVFP